MDTRSGFKVTLVVFILMMLATGTCAFVADEDAGPSFNAGGVSTSDDGRISTNYIVLDSLGQFAVDTSNGDQYQIEHGYWHGVLFIAVDAAPLFSAGGVSVAESARVSTHYMVVDSLGQFAVGTSSGPGGEAEHGYWHSGVVILLADTPGAAKMFSDGKTVRVGTMDIPLVVTSGTSLFADRFYVEAADRSSGIAVRYGPTGGPSLTEGDKIVVVGVLTTVDGERMLQSAFPTEVGAAAPLTPVFLTIPNLGGSDLNVWTPGALDGKGLNNIGLLVKTYGGMVSYRDPEGRFFYVDNGDNLFDGSQPGIRVICDGFLSGSRLVAPSLGDKIIVTGISSLIPTGSGYARAIRPRYQTEIEVVIPD